MTSDAQYRAAVVTLLTDCAADAGVQLQVHRARPRSLYPPTGFVDGMRTDLDPFPGTSTLYQHNRRIDVLMIWGLFDAGEAVDQRDAWMDAFHAWSRVEPHAASAESLLGPLSYSDEPTFVPDWLPEAQQVPHFATRIVLEGFATD